MYNTFKLGFLLFLTLFLAGCSDLTDAPTAPVEAGVELIAQASYPPLPGGKITYVVHDGVGYIGQPNPLAGAQLNTTFGYRIEAVGGNIDLNGQAPVSCTTYLRGSIGGKWENKGTRYDGKCLLPPAPKKFGAGESRLAFRATYPNGQKHDIKASFTIVNQSSQGTTYFIAEGDALSVPTLTAGDKLLLQRGGTWQGPLHLTHSGTSAAPIIVGAYGSGPKPIIRGSGNANIYVDDVSHLIIENLATRHQPSDYDYIATDCRDTPVGWRLGVEVDGGSNVTIRNVDVKGSSAGVRAANGAINVTLENSRIYENTGMWALTYGGNDDVGATAVLVNADNMTIRGNEFFGNEACAYDEFVNYSTGIRQDGSSIEIYDARGTLIENNVSRDVAFSELGSGAITTSGTVFRSNLHNTTEPGAIGINVQGNGGDFGPVLNTTLENNTFDLLGSDESQAVVWGNSGTSCNGTMTNNTLNAEWKAIYAEGPIAGSGNTSQGIVQLFEGATWNNPNACG